MKYSSQYAWVQDTVIQLIESYLKESVRTQKKNIISTKSKKIMHGLNYQIYINMILTQLKRR